MHAFVAGVSLGLYSAVVDLWAWNLVGFAILVLPGLRQFPENSERLWTQIKNEWAYFLGGVVPGIVLHLLLGLRYVNLS